MSTLISITVSPSNPYILISNQQQFTATAHFSDASPLDVTTNSLTAWDVGTTGVLSNSVASINNSTSKGLATAKSISGYTVIRATYQGFTGSAILRVGLTNYTQIWEQVVESTKVSSLPNYNAHNPIAKLTVPNFSLMTGGVVFENQTGTSNSIPIGWTTVSGHPDSFAIQYLAHEQQYDGYWVGLGTDGYVTSNLSTIVKNIGVVTSICVDTNQNPLTHGGYPVLVQLTGEAYVYTQDSTITLGCWLGPNTAIVGAVMNIGFSISTTTPALGFALENYSATYQNMVKMRIQICGE